MEYRKNRKTRKIERGGDIHNRKAFQDILSIGYELETSSLSKFTLISETTEDGYPILMNTDTARKDLETLQTKNQSEEDEEEEEDNLFALRQEEVFEFDAYNRHNKVDKNVSFLVTNDIVDSPFIKFLNTSCREVEEEKEEEIRDSEKYQEYEKITFKRIDENEEKIRIAIKAYREFRKIIKKPLRNSNLTRPWFSSGI